MLKSKKAFIMHPGTWIAGAFILGAAFMYFVAKGTIPVPIPVC
jgi:hypothetical protein